ncbi:MAG TPA: high-potential iron-sulfur protein [Steroidobacteraceae bacterium]|nr:high-potential iron-sulfur protein [Steroidobacteraceae bacterium]
MTESISRRALLKRLSLTAGVGAAVPVLPTRAEEPALLDANDPAAVKVSYILEASLIDRSNHPDYVPGSRCENCMLIQDKPGFAYRPCSLFPGRLVKVSGWCTSWQPQL